MGNLGGVASIALLFREPATCNRSIGMKSLTRRHVLSGTGSIALDSIAPGSMGGSAFAQVAAGQGQGLLAKLQAAKKIRIGIVNSPPYSALNPDGTVTGAVPTITKRIMDRLGIPEIEGFLASYGDLIPGMQAGRWDFVSAALTITKARCGQVKFGDPLIFDGANIVALKDHPGPMPKHLSGLAKGNFIVGAPAGGVDLKSLLEAGVSADNIRQFTNDQSAVTLGFSPGYRFFRIILPQALPVTIPPFGNALVTTLKFPSLV
jgi:polar amino acid transport system substrate-binding protein